MDAEKLLNAGLAGWVPLCLMLRGAVLLSRAKSLFIIVHSIEARSICVFFQRFQSMSPLPLLASVSILIPLPHLQTDTCVGPFSILRGVWLGPSFAEGVT